VLAGTFLSPLLRSLVPERVRATGNCDPSPWRKWLENQTVEHASQLALMVASTPVLEANWAGSEWYAREVRGQLVGDPGSGRGATLVA